MNLWEAYLWGVPSAWLFFGFCVAWEKTGEELEENLWTWLMALSLGGLMWPIVIFGSGVLWAAKRMGKR